MKLRTRSGHIEGMGAFRSLLALAPNILGATALVERARADDQTAFRAIFDRHAPEVHRFLRGVLGHHSAADEATQETFVRAFRRIDGLREEEKLLPWLLGIARRVSLEQRRAARRSRYVDPDPDALEAIGAEVNPEEILLGRELIASAARALEALPTDRRTALLLRIDHGLGYDEIAAAMDWSLPKVKNEIHRARLQLRACMAEEADT